MKRGELYRVERATQADPRQSRVYVIVSRPEVIQSHYSTVICAPVYTAYAGLETQVPVGAQEGLKHDSSIHCDGLVSIYKAKLTDYVGRLSPVKLDQLNRALLVALDIASEPN